MDETQRIDPEPTQQSELDRLSLEAIKARTSGNRAAAIERWLRVVALGVFIIFCGAATYVLIADVIPAARALEKANNATADGYPALETKVQHIADTIDTKLGDVDTAGLSAALRQRLVDLGVTQQQLNDLIGVVAKQSTAIGNQAQGAIAEMKTTTAQARKAFLEPGGFVSNLDASVNKELVPAMTTSVRQVGAAAGSIQGAANELTPTIVDLDKLENQGTVALGTFNATGLKLNEFMGTSGTPDSRGIPIGGSGLIGVMGHVNHTSGLADKAATDLFNPPKCENFGCYIKRGLTFGLRFADFALKVENQIKGAPVDIVGGAIGVKKQ